MGAARAEALRVKRWSNGGKKMVKQQWPKKWSSNDVAEAAATRSTAVQGAKNGNRTAATMVKKVNNNGQKEVKGWSNDGQEEVGISSGPSSGSKQQ